MKKKLKKSEIYRIIDEEWNGRYGIMQEEFEYVRKPDIDSEDVSIMTNHLYFIYSKIDVICDYILDNNDFPLFEKLAKLIQQFDHLKDFISEGYEKHWDEDKIDFTQWQEIVFCYIEKPIHDLGNKLEKYHPEKYMDIERLLYPELYWNIQSSRQPISTDGVAVLGPMSDIHDNREVKIYHNGRTDSSKPAKRKATENKTKTKKTMGDKPMTLKYYKHGNNSLLMKQRNRVDIVFRKWNEWKWIDDRTTANDFDSFFEGEPRHCNITWTANTTVMTILLQELLKQPYIEEQTGCSAKSLVEQQFGKKANWNKDRMDSEAVERIKIILIILDIRNPLPEPHRRGDDEVPDISDAALKAIYAGELRETKGV